MTRSLFYAQDSEKTMKNIGARLEEIVLAGIENHALNANALKEHIRSGLGIPIFSRTKRKPMIIPVIMEV